MGLEPELQSALLSAVPEMRAFALRLCRRADRADDLVQDTLLRAIANIHTFQPGTNMAAWLFTILRHSFLNDYRRTRREAPDADGDVVDSLMSQPDQEAHIQLGELLAALAQLSADQREAVLLVGAGIPYSEAAHMCHCEVGTIKSRVCRARARLAELMAIEAPQDLGPDRTVHAALTARRSRWSA